MIVNLIRNGVEEQVFSNEYCNDIKNGVVYLNARLPISFPEDADNELKLLFFIPQEALVNIPYFLEIKADCKNPRIAATFKFFLEDIRETDEEVILTYKA